MSSSSSYLPARSSATQRRPAQTPPNRTVSGLPSNLEPAPVPKPIFQVLAFVLVISLGLLQLLPATHFRDSRNPRNWIPINSTPSSKVRDSSVGSSGNDGEDGLVHVVSWVDCLDLRMLAVLANSTLSNSKLPDLLHFHFFIPEGGKDKVSFYKLKVLFPNSSLEVYGQEEVKQLIRTATSEAEYAKLNLEEIAPFVIPSVHQFLKRFIYVKPNMILKGSIEEIHGVDKSLHPIAVAEDCFQKLNTYVNYDVLDTIQKSASKPWVPETPYPKDACLPDLSLLLVDARILQKDFLQAILWWSNVPNWSKRNGEMNPAIVLALYNKHQKLSDAWLVKDSTLPESIYTSMITHYDGPQIVCSENGSGKINQQLHDGNIWKKYLPQMSDQILGG